MDDAPLLTVADRGYSLAARLEVLGSRPSKMDSLKRASCSTDSSKCTRRLWMSVDCTQDLVARDMLAGSSVAQVPSASFSQSLESNPQPCQLQGEGRGESHSLVRVRDVSRVSPVTLEGYRC